MATAIIGTGNIGGTLARNLVRGGEPVVLAAKDEAHAAALAHELGELARAASVEEAIAEADAVVFAGYAKSRSGTLASHVAVAGCEPAGRSHPQKRRDPGIRAAWLTAPQAAPLGPE